MSGLEPEARDLVDSIRHYLLERPFAADTVKGVASEWLGLRAGVAWLETVERALDHLVANGEMQRQMLADGKVMYSGTRVRS